MLPQPIFSFENFKDLATIVELKRIQKQVTYFCTRPLASRVEGLCEPYKVRLIITEFTKLQLIGEYVIQFLDIVIVKGKNEPVKIYEVISQGRANKEKQIELNLYEKAHHFYVKGEFSEAKNAFIYLYNKYEKYLYKLYKKRSQELLDANVKEFDGVFKFSSK